MGYYIDTQKITIKQYQQKLLTTHLTPSRLILKERMEERFGYLQSIGINNVLELTQTLKKKDKFHELQQVECLSGEYLIILLRELKSLTPKPNRLRDFPGITIETITKLEQSGIKNTLKLFERVLNPELRKQLAEETGISNAEILELTKLTDLSRVRWIGHTFARMLYDIGFNTVEKLTQADPEDLHFKINTYNKEHGIYRGQIGLNDMKIVVNTARDVPQDIEY